MIAHARHASQSYPNVIVKSPDTDVFVIALNSCLGINANMFFETGIQNARRIISLNNMRQHLGVQWCMFLTNKLSRIYRYLANTLIFVRSTFDLFYYCRTLIFV